MANTYYDATGVLVLDKITPVINALFGDYRMDKTHPGNGEVYIARISDENYPSWDGVLENLDDLAAGLSISVAEADTENVGAVLRVLSEHFNATDNASLSHLIENEDFTEEVSLKALFTLAICFDDGHGLKAIKWEGAWHSDRPRLFEFGGNGLYLSKSVIANSNSSQALSLGENLHTAILQGDLNQAAAHLDSEVSGLLRGIGDESIRGAVRLRLADMLLKDSRSVHSESET